MGSQIIARCDCGVEASILIGCGEGGPQPCYFPCLCDNCHGVVQVDLLEEQIRCPQCESTKVIPYDDPKLSMRSGRTTVTEWNMAEELGRKLKLSDGKYRCPRCNQMTLQFTDGRSNWD